MWMLPLQKCSSLEAKAKKNLFVEAASDKIHRETKCCCSHLLAGAHSITEANKYFSYFHPREVLQLVLNGFLCMLQSGTKGKRGEHFATYK